MAMTMADNSIRKACDRCHSQKLSCRRIGEEPCERCTRLKTECNFSPSLRHKKQSRQQQQKQQQQQQQQQKQIQQHQPQPQDHQHQHQQQAQQLYGHQQPPPPPPPPPHHQIHHQNFQQVPHQDGLGAETTPVVGSRSPKRRRTSSDPILVLPETLPAGSRTEALTGKPHSLVTSETGLDISEFNFNFDQLGFFAPPHSEHLSHPAILSDNLHTQPVQQAGGFINSWEHHHLPTTSEAFPGIDHTQHQPQAQHPLSQPQTGLHRSPQIPASSPVAFRGRASQPKPASGNSSNSNKRPRFRYGQSPGHISFLDTTSLRQLQESNSSPSTTWEASPVVWMAELNEINVRLLELSTALSEAQEATQPLGRPSNERFRDNGWPIDEMFNLTQRVADILDQLAATATERRASADPGNSMFVLSTYVRLLDMYQKVFGLVQTEVAQTDPDEMLIIASEEVFQFWKLPNVNIGSIPVNSTPSLAMFLTAQLANNFLRRLRKATAALDASLRNPKDGTVNGQAGAGTSATSLFVDVSYEMVKNREETLTKHLAELRKELASIIPMLDCDEEEEE